MYNRSIFLKATSTTLLYYRQTIFNQSDIMLSYVDTMCFFFMGTKVFVNLTHLKLPQISKSYLKIFVWSGHLIKIHLE